MIQYVNFILQEQKPGKKARSTQYKKERRKRYRDNKKNFLNKSWQDLTIDALKLRWKERCKKSHAAHILREIHEKKTAQRLHEVDRIENSYKEQNCKDKDAGDTYHCY